METDLYPNEPSAFKTVESARINREEHEVEALDYLNKILRGELSAVESYSKVIEKFPADAQRFDLALFRQEHQRNVEDLRQLLRVQGADVSDTSGAWGSTVGAMLSIASFMGDKSAVTLLIEGEEHGLNQYSDVLNYKLPESIRTKVAETFLPQARINIGKLRGIANVI